MENVYLFFSEQNPQRIWFFFKFRIELQTAPPPPYFSRVGGLWRSLKFCTSIEKNQTIFLSIF